MGTSVAIAVALLFVGLLLAFGEVMLPSGGILTILSGAAIVGSVVFAFQGSSGLGAVFIVAAAVLVPMVIVMGFRILPHTKVGKQLILERPAEELSGSGSQDEKLRDLAGQEGIALNVLRPSGTAQIEGRKYDVVTEGTIVEKNARIRVVQVRGDRVVVEPVRNA